MLDHTHYLQLALEEAEIACVHGDIPVGALLVDETGQILATTRNEIYSLKGFVNHAEMSLILQNQDALFTHEWTTTLYATFEPCLMCMSTAIINHIKRIVWAADDHWAGGTQSLDFSSYYLRSYGVEFVATPNLALQQRSVALMKAYLQRSRPDKVAEILGAQLTLE